MKNKCIIIGGSAGSLQAVLHILEDCPANFKPPIVIVVHRGENEQNLLLELIRNKSKRPVKEVEHYDYLEQNTVYLAPTNYHVLIGNDYHMELDFSEKILYSRPSIDVSFISFSKVFKQHLIAILLSGANKDGTKGVSEILNYKGSVIVQDPNDAKVDVMPNTAIDTNPNIKYVLPTAHIFKTVLTLLN